MKKLLEILVCFLHPLAVVLIWIDLATDRPDLKPGGKLAWGIFALIPLVPFLYIFTGGAVSQVTGGVPRNGPERSQQSQGGGSGRPGGPLDGPREPPGGAQVGEQ